MDTDLEDELKVSLFVNDQLRARIAELEAALKPFADFINCVSGSKHFEQMSDNHIVMTTGAGGGGKECEKWIYMKHLRAARAALEKK